MSNVYYSPEELGLEPLGEFEIHEADYSFDIFAAWRDPKTGLFYSASDSGCSCPSPFEDYNSLESLTMHETAHSLVAEIQAIEDPYESPADLIAKVMSY